MHVLLMLVCSLDSGKSNQDGRTECAVVLAESFNRPQVVC